MKNESRSAVLQEFHLREFLLHLAIVAFEHAVLHLEAGGHRLVVADALRVVAAGDVVQLVGEDDRALRHHLVVANDAERHVRRDHRKLVEFGLGEEAVRNLDDALTLHLFAVEVVADKDGVFVVFVNVEQTNDLKQSCGRDMVDDGAVFDGSHHEVFAFHKA